MPLIPVSIDPIVVEGILIGTIITIASVVSAIAVMKAAPQTKGSPSRAESRAISGSAGSLSMSVAAQAKTSDSLNLRFTLPNPDITLLRIELANQLDKGTGTAQCIKEASRMFVATVEPKVVQRWYNANPYWDGETKQLPIRVSFITKGQAGCQTIWATMSSRTMAGSGSPDAGIYEWVLRGPCTRAHPALALMPRQTRRTRG